MNRTALLYFSIATALTIGGCSSAGPEPTESLTTTQTVTKPEIAASLPPAPAQVNKGRSAVTFDPCVDIGDTTITEAGFNPRTRERADFTSDFYSYRGCKFTRGDEQGLLTRLLTVQSSNVTMAETRERYGAAVRNAPIAGREAIIFKLPEDKSNDTCFLTLPTRDGTLSIQLGVSRARTAELPCDTISGVAEVLATTLKDQ